MDALAGLGLADLVVAPLGPMVAGMPDRPDTEVVDEILAHRPELAPKKG